VVSSGEDASLAELIAVMAKRKKLVIEQPGNSDNGEARQVFNPSSLACDITYLCLVIVM
jgi:hypothetical protein